MLHFFLQKSRRISHTGFLHVPRSWLEDTNPPLVGIAGSVLANYRAYRCFVSAWTAKQKRRQRPTATDNDRQRPTCRTCRPTGHNKPAAPPHPLLSPDACLPVRDRANSNSNY